METLCAVLPNCLAKFHLKWANLHNVLSKMCDYVLCCVQGQCYYKVRLLTAQSGSLAPNTITAT